MKQYQLKQWTSHPVTEIEVHVRGFVFVGLILAVTRPK